MERRTEIVFTFTKLVRESHTKIIGTKKDGIFLYLLLGIEKISAEILQNLIILN